MRKTFQILGLTSAIAILPYAGQAQSRGAICESVTQLAPGQWVEYTMTGANMGMGGGMAGPTSVWMGHVGTEQRDGVEHIKYESRIMGPQTIVTQILTTGEGGPWDMSSVVEMTVQLPGQAPMTMTGSMLDMARQQDQTPNIADECEMAEVIGNESVTVPAGTIQTLHMRSADGHEVWASPDVPLAIVKMVTQDGPVMELKDHGTGATSSMN